MRSLPWLTLTTACTLIALGTIASTRALSMPESVPIQPPVHLLPAYLAVRLSDGQVYFTEPPRLVDAVTTERRAAASTATYYFTLSVPEGAGESLQRVEIALKDGDTALRRIRLDTEDSRAFVGTPDDRGDDVALDTVTFDRDRQTAVVQFAQPVAPGTTVTIGLRPRHNPRLGGVYLFGVTAFPQGEPAYGQFLGYGRFHIDDASGDPFFMR